jgi:hypothetical protein
VKVKRMKTKLAIRVLIGSLFAVIVVSGCPNPINNQTFLQMTDKNAPTVDISSPAGSTPYTQTVTVQGTALDSEGRLKGVAWTVTGVLGLLEEGQIPPSEIGTDGIFNFQFGTLSFSGPIAITVKATDWNDNVGQATITLAEPDGQLSSFTAEPSNKTVTLDWEEVPGATYSIYYTTNGTLPTIDTADLTPAAPPVTITGLSNGAVHVFLLKAHTATADYWSSYVKAIPLSPFTLAPMVTPGYRQLRLDWNAISGTDEFEIYRAGTPSGPWTNYTGVVRGTSYVDENVNEAQSWYYKVKPAMPGSIGIGDAMYNGARPLSLPISPVDAIVSLLLPGSTNRVRSSSDGEWAFIAGGSAGVLVVQLNPMQYPRLFATIPTYDNAQDIETFGNYAYVADGAGGLVVLDISQPDNVQVVGQCTTNITNAAGVSLITQGVNQLYAVILDATGNTTMHAVDIATPTNPQWLASYSNASYNFKDVTSTYYDNWYNYIFGCTRESLVRLRLLYSGGLWQLGWAVDYTDANYFSDAVSIKSQTTPADYLYRAGEYRFSLEPPWAYQLKAHSISTISTVVGSSPTCYGYFRDAGGSFTISGSRAYVGDGRGLQVIDITNPASQALVGFWNTQGAPLGADVIPAGTHAFVAAGSLGFQIVTLAQQNNPQEIGIWPSANNITDVAIRDYYAYVCVAGAGLQILRVDDPSNIQVLGSIVDARMPNPRAVALSGKYAFVVDGTNGFLVLDVESPGSPAGVVGTAPSMLGSMEAIAVKGDFAYTASTRGLQVFDISDPTQPFSVGHYDTDGGGMHDIAIAGNTLYTPDGNYFQPSNLIVLDISAPADPVLIGKAPAINSTYGGFMPDSVSINGTWAFMSDDMTDNGLYAIDINPASATFLTTYGPCDTAAGATSGHAEGVVAYGNLAYVIDTNNPASLAIIDISSPKLLNDTYLRRSIALTWGNIAQFRVRMAWEHLFVTDATGLRIFGFSP